MKKIFLLVSALIIIAGAYVYWRSYPPVYVKRISGLDIPLSSRLIGKENLSTWQDARTNYIFEIAPEFATSLIDSCESLGGQINRVDYEYLYSADLLSQSGKNFKELNLGKDDACFIKELNGREKWLVIVDKQVLFFEYSVSYRR